MAVRNDTQARELPATGYAVLGLLSFGEELSGYDLKKWADHSLRFFYWSPAISNIYTELRRLEQLGYVEAEEVAQDDLRNKRVFAITDAGRDALTAWVESPVVAPPVLKDQVLLKVWLGHAAERDHLVDLVREEQAAAEEVLAKVRHTYEVARASNRWGYAALVERFCERLAGARVEALAELRRDLEDEEDDEDEEVRRGRPAARGRGRAART